ncbi:MAG: hypothetical protein ABR538_00580 [Candidatus Binatia bacterium]
MGIGFTTRSMLALAAAAMLLAPRAASAQPYDHLQCFKVKDPTSFPVTTDLRPARSDLFEVAAGCSVKVRSRQLCFPAKKELTAPPLVHLDISGQDLANAFLCYKVKCPQEQPPASLQMSDQFGTRTLVGLRTSTLCTPAIAGSPPVTTTTTSTLPEGPPRSCVDATPPNCDGTCDNFNFSCEAQSGACVCVYVDVFGGCPRPGAGAPECWGSCQGTQTCIEVSGACQCGFAF